MESLEEVGLADAVAARDQDEARSEAELELRVRADGGEPDELYDQPASLIGMIR